MRHYIFTRSAYGPEWTPEANAHRLAITQGITVRMMALQSVRDWTWVVCIDERDPLIDQRVATFASAAPDLIVIRWRPGVLAPAPWDHSIGRHHKLEQVAATAYRAPWREQTGLADDTILMTRLDDDDALTRDALARVRLAAEGVDERRIFMHPVGYRVWRHRASLVRHESNAMHTLLTPPGDTASVYDYGHTVARRFAPVVVVDQEPAWLWSRHSDTISGHKQASKPFSNDLRVLFPVDWSVLDAKRRSPKHGPARPAPHLARSTARARRARRSVARHAS